MFDLQVSQDKLVGVRMQWGVRIPTRDGVNLCGTLYLPERNREPAPAICTLTPYVAQMWHDFGMYFAAQGFPFVAVDVRGRGNSEGMFQPLVHEAKDGHDIVEWLGHQPYCNGQVAMWGGSYAGYSQWATAKEFPPHLATIVPVAAPYVGVDFPTRSNIPESYLMQWLTLVSGRTSQEKMFWSNGRFWAEKFRRWFEAGVAFKELDVLVGNPSPIFQDWIRQPQQSAYWDRCNPTTQQYGELSLPILTITGSCDGNQLGALTHYREHMKHASAATRARHHLVIGPWDHSGTRIPKSEFAGLKVGPASLIDLQQLHVQWYAWTMQRGPKPRFLQNNVTYYVMTADKWRYADTLEDVTASCEPFYLHAPDNPTDVFKSGQLIRGAPVDSGPDQYIYDPRDVSLAQLESTLDPESRTDHHMVYAAAGKQQFVYHSAPFEADTEISGFFALSVYLSIDQPDTDFRAAVYEITIDGRAVQLSMDYLRARYRESFREEKLIRTQEPLLYELKRFMFISRLIKRGSRLRLVIGPQHSIYTQKNYNSGAAGADESIEDARAVTVKLFHDRAYPSALYVPFGQPETDEHAEPRSP